MQWSQIGITAPHPLARDHMNRFDFHISRDLRFLRIKEDVKIEYDAGFGPTFVWDVPEEMVKRLVTWLLKVE